MPRTLAALAAAAAVLAVALPARSAERLSDADKAFIISDLQGARYELALAQQGNQISMRPEVKDYAKQLVADHREYNEALERLAAKHRILTPPGLKQDDKDRLDKMGQQSGTEYDRAFIAEMKRVNAQDVQDSQAEASSTQARDVKSFLQKFASLDEKHEREAEALGR